MKKKLVRLTESELKNMIHHSVNKILKEWGDEYTDQYFDDDIDRLEGKYSDDEYLNHLDSNTDKDDCSETDWQNKQKLQELGLEECVGCGITVPENFLNKKGRQIIQQGGRVYEWQICIPSSSSFSPEYNFKTAAGAAANCELYLKHLTDPQNIKATVYVIGVYDGKIKAQEYASWHNGQWN